MSKGGFKDDDSFIEKGGFWNICSGQKGQADFNLRNHPCVCAEGKGVGGLCEM